MKIRIFLALLLLALPVSAAQRDGMTLLGVSQGVKNNYTGPGDIVSGATVWYSCSRGYSASYAAPGTGKACNVRRASDNATQDIAILSNGSFDIASYNTFVGTDATGTCTIASTTLTCTGLGSTLHINDPISGAGIGQQCYLTAIGTFTAGSQTATINSSSLCGTVSVGVTVTAQVAGFATKTYDQSGNVNDASQTTAGNQPQILPSIQSSKPGLNFTTSAAQVVISGSAITANQPFTESGVVQFNGTGTQTPFLGTGQARCIDHSGANTVQLFAGSFGGSVTVSDGSYNAYQAIFNGASSILFVNGTSNAQSPGAGNISAVTATLGGSGSCGNFMNGPVGEFGIWTGAFSAGNQASMHTNQSAFYGTP